MIFIKRTLLHAVKHLFRKAHRKRNLLALLLVTVLLCAASQIFAGLLPSEGWLQLVLAFCVRWLWLPLTLLFLILRHGEIRKRRAHTRFFLQKSFWGYDGNVPQYQWQEPLTPHISVVRFHSRIPLAEWVKIQSDLEIHLGKRIKKIDNFEGSLTIMDIYAIEQKLANLIHWRDELMAEGRRFVVGENLMGPVIWDAVNLPHGLVAGSTNSGKTTLLRCIIRQAILKKFNITVLDFKAGGDFAGLEAEVAKYCDLEEGYGNIIVTEPEPARDLLISLVVEVRGRLDVFKEAGVANIDEYNASGHGKFVPWLVVLDEAAEILDVKPKDKAEKELYNDIDSSLRTLARLSRAAGVHLLMGFIRPDSDVLSGQIKNNLLWRACGYFADAPVSRIVLGNDAATTLPPNVKGRFIIDGEETQAYYLPMPDTGNREENGDSSD